MLPASDSNALRQFIADNWAELNVLDDHIAAVQTNAADPGAYSGLLRTVHTINCMSGLIGLPKLGEVAWATESVLRKVRDGELETSRDNIALILRSAAELKRLLHVLEASGKESEEAAADLIQQLECIAAVSLSGGEQIPASGTEPRDSREAERPSAESVAALAQDALETQPVSVAQAAASDGAQLEQSGGDNLGAKANKVTDLSIRVHVDVLDSLMNLVGELVLTRNQLLQLARGDDESKYTAPITLLNRVTTDLQEGVMKTRMQPIGSVWSTMPRIIRDLRQTTGKQIELEMRGNETELDRTVLEAIRDPLTHMIRNSADHGLETPEVRRKKGKSETGTIKLDAYHEGGHVIISIADDGAGINVKRVREKAIAQGLVTEADAARMPEHEMLRFIFRPGFSTAQQVTSLSGRGVGMDVVKTSIEKIGGTVDLSSVADKGTSVRIRIPLTLAIVSALVVESGGESFAIPQLGVVELVRLAAEEKHRIEHIHNNEVFRLRHRLLPLIRLDSVVQLPSNRTDDSDVNIVVVQVGNQQFGLIVDRVFDTEEIVVKPMGSLLKDIAIYQGTTILGDGRVIMILDVSGIATEIGLSSMASELAESADRGQDSDTTNLLCFNAGDGRSMSVPLSLVSRLEEVPSERIETAGDREVVQYRGDLLPLIPVHGYSRRDANREIQPVIVFQENGCAMGLMVNEIEDIVEDRLVIRMPSRQPGVVGTAIINDRATEIVDAHHYVIQANPDWFHHNHWRPSLRILLAEDSVFFRQLMTTSLISDGHQVKATGDGQDAIDVLERDTQFDVVLSDIEMPGVDGLNFVRWIRSKPQFKDLPVIAISGNTKPSMEADALRAGFTHFMRKFDPLELKNLLLELSANHSQKGASA